MAPRALSRSLAAITRPILEKRGAAFASLIAGWAEIAGPRLATDTMVARLSSPRDRAPGTLHLRVTPALALEIQHLAPQLIERINAHLGYAAVGRITLLQAPLRRSRPAVLARQRIGGPPEASARATSETASIDDPELRESLQRLGRQVLKSG
ncbi:MAG: DUF721 domain-containing protein [Alphaproteobacteria bacterium]|nr:DUF721 domain-containing protein [Alphaproteobacteria bacterium]